VSVISLHPDPAHPRGGFALLSLPEDRLPGETTEVAVFDNYSERYLGESGWQPVKVLFGPYSVMREAGRARLVIGPEIVNQIEEYANVRLMVGDTETNISWPDDIVPAPGAARIGGIMSASSAEPQAKGTLTAQLPADDPEPVAPPEPLDETARGFDVGSPEIKSQHGRSGIWIGLLVLLLLAAGLAYWFLNMDGPRAEVDDRCGPNVLNGLADFAAQTEALRACGSKVSADTALRLVERAAAAGNAEALDLFGVIYDGGVTAPVIEQEIGLTFGDVPATAAEYYARAVDAGSGDARDNLAALCERMATMTDTLVRGAVADYCDQ
jgi:hypothetical protein